MFTNDLTPSHPVSLQLVSVLSFSFFFEAKLYLCVHSQHSTEFKHIKFRCLLIWILKLKDRV